MPVDLLRDVINLNQGGRMRVLVIDDHELVWGGMSLNIKSLTKSQEWPEMHCEGRPSVEKAVELAGQHFDLILLDYHLPGISGLEGLACILKAFETSPVVMCSADEDPRLVREAIQRGAAGYLYKRMTGKQMQAALSVVLAQGVYLPPMALLEVEPVPDEALPELPQDSIEMLMREVLSPRQREVFSGTLRGKANKVIARELGIAEGTVKVHLALVYRALGVRNRTEAMYLVFSAGAAGALDRI